MDVLSLRGILTLDKSEYDKGLTEADTQAKGFGGKMSKAMKVGTAAVAALGAGTVLLSKKLVDGAKDVAKYGDHVDKMSQKIGISSDAYQKWDYVMKRAGGNVDSLKMGMKTLSQQAEKGSDAFQKLGISQEEVGNLSKEELFEKTVKGLSEMEEGTERTALATQLLGRAGADMGPLLNQGSDAIEEQMEIAEKYGMVMPEEAVKASAAFEDSMTTMQMTAQGLKNRLLGEFLPSMTKITDGLALMFTGDMSGLDDVVEGIKGFIGKIGEMAPKVLEAGGKIIGELVKGLVEKIPEILATGSKLFANLLTGLQNSLKNAQPVVTQIIQGIANFFASNAPQLLTTALTLMATLAQGLIKAIPTLIASIPTIIKGLADAFTNYDWTETGKSIIVALGKGISSAASVLKSVLTAPIRGARDVISNGFRAAKDKAVSWMNSLKSSVTSKITAAKDAVKRIVDKIKGFFPLKVGKIFSNLKIPKIDIKGGKAPFGLGGLGTKPSISVKWNKKAENVPYLFTNATLFGAGEGVQDEVMYGKGSLMKDITEAVDNSNSNGVQIVNYITVSGAENPEDFAERFSRRLKLDMRTA